MFAKRLNDLDSKNDDTSYFAPGAGISLRLLQPHVASDS
jgi:hypothetical protein